MFISQSWIRYVDRTYQQIKTQVLTALATRVPEITDHTEGNVFVKMIGIWGGIAEMLGYYTDNAAREAFIGTCRLYKSAVKIARLQDYRVRARTAATADITFTLNVVAPSPVLIPIGTEVQTDEGLRFFTTIAATIPTGQLSITVAARQAVSVLAVALGNSSGVDGEEFSISDKVVDSSVVLRVNGLAWSQSDTLGFSLSTDTVFVQSVNEQQQVIVKFGNNINGKIPPNGDPIDVDYFECEGAGGNVGANTIINIIPVISLPSLGMTISCTNINAAAGGAEIETLTQLRHRIPLALRTLRRAVNTKDHTDVAELAPGVALGGVVFNCGKYVEIYIVPDGGGIASTGLLASTQVWMDERKILTRLIAVKAAGEVQMLFDITLKVLPQYNQAATVALVKTNLTNFLSYIYQSIGGTVQMGDVYQVIENTLGVAYCNIVSMTPVPYARPTGTTVTPLVWTRAILSTNNTVDQWDVKFTSNTNFQLFRNNSFLGNFSTGVVISEPQLTFTITPSGYAANDFYEFYTYPYSGNLVLAEPSLPVTSLTNITISASGGV